MRFRILGPLEVEVDGELLDLGPKKQRSLFALLLINQNRVVSTDRILDQLWGDEAAGKENALWVYVSRLRGVLGDATREPVLVTKDHGYSLIIDPEAFDAYEFQQLTDRGSSTLQQDPEAASADLSAALDLWRGRALEEFEYDEFARSEITRLDQLRTTCLDNRIEADLKRGLSGELIGELDRLVDERPLDEHPVSQLMLAQYRAGRQADALRSFERFRRGVGEELGLDPSPELRRLEEQILLHDSRLQARPTASAAGYQSATTRGENPFRGLEAFREEDANLFFGRDGLVSDIIRRVADVPIVSIIGSSGCGKSSAVRSGVIPAIRKGSIAGSDSWLIAQMVPGSKPFAEIEAALLRTSLEAPSSLRDQLDGAPDEILRAVFRVSPNDDTRVVIVVDQFEELFTLCDSDVCNRFLTALAEAASDPHGRVRVMITLRADFYDRPLGHPGFGTAMNEGIVNVVPMAPEELEQAASQPSARAGVRLEPGLEAALIGDVLGEPGALPLFQFALTDLYDRRVGDTLTLTAYRDMGGVQGAVGRKAELLYKRLTSDQKAAARQVFLRLVAIADSETRSRRRVEASELLELDLDVGDLQAVLQTFGQERLLSFDRNDVSGSPTVEVAHEALLENWDRLADWIDKGTEDVRRNVRLTAAASEWNDKARADGYLLVGGRLNDYVEWAEVGTMTLARTEQEYLDASVSARDAVATADAERVERELASTKRAKRNLLGLVAVVITAAVVGSYFLWTALQPEPTVALLYRGQGADSVNDMIGNGFDRAVDDFDFIPTRVAVLSEMEAEMRTVAEAGTDLIIAGIDYGFAIEQVAPEFLETTFIAMDSEFDSPLPNVTVLGFADEQGAYLMGVAAALKSEAQHVGLVGAGQFGYLEQFIGPYVAGARSIDSDIEISVDWVSQSYSYAAADGFQNPEAAREAAMHLFELGADVIFQVANESGEGVHEAAVAYSAESGGKVWTIGVDVDEGFEASPPVSDHILTSMVKRYDTAVYAAIKAYLDDTLTNEILYGLENGGISHSPFGDHLVDVAEHIEAARHRVIDGAAAVPSITAHPSTFRSTAAQAVDIVFNGAECTADPIDPVVVGETVSFTVINNTDEAAGITLASIDSNVSNEALLDSEFSFYEHSWVHNWWLVPPDESYEMRADFEGGSYGGGIVLCWVWGPDRPPIVAARFPVSNF